MTIYGYAVPADGQSLDAQLGALKTAGCERETIFLETVHGAKADRPQLARLLATIESGDVLVVTRLDRLARSKRDLLNVLDALAQRNAAFRSLGDQWADTTPPPGPPARPALDAETARAARAFMQRLEGRYPAIEGLVFGSRARGTYRPDSDADLAVVLKGERGDRYKVSGDMAEIAFDVMMETSILIDPLPLWEDELRRPERFSNPALIDNIKREGLRL